MGTSNHRKAARGQCWMTAVGEAQMPGAFANNACSRSYATTDHQEGLKALTSGLLQEPLSSWLQLDSAREDSRAAA